MKKLSLLMAFILLMTPLSYIQPVCAEDAPSANESVEALSDPVYSAPASDVESGNGATQKPAEEDADEILSGGGADGGDASGNGAPQSVPSAGEARGTDEGDEDEPAEQEEPVDSNEQEEPADPKVQEGSADPGKQEDPADPKAQEAPGDPGKQEEPADPDEQEGSADPGQQEDPGDPKVQEGSADPGEQEAPADPKEHGELPAASTPGAGPSAEEGLSESAGSSLQTALPELNASGENEGDRASDAPYDAEIKLNKNRHEMMAGEELQLNAHLFLAEGTEPAISWYSSDPGVASVSADGRVTGISAGEAYITVETETGKTDVCRIVVTAPSAGSGTYEKTDFRDDWQFCAGDENGAEAPEFNDSGWRTVSVPHDYSSEGDFSWNGETESGNLEVGPAWYRKHFVLSPEDADKVVQVHFDGVYMNSSIYVNGVKVGEHPYGYTPFSFDLSKYVVCDGETENVLAVKVDHEPFSSRWYSGSGIIRGVSLAVKEKIYIPQYGISVRTPSVAEGNYDTHITTVVRNEYGSSGSVRIVQTLYDENGVPVASGEGLFTLTEGKNDIEQVLNVLNAELWSPDTPHVYQLRTDIIEEGEVLDSQWTEIGYRYFSFDADTGFSLNGENLKLKGVNLHSDYGALGTAENETAIRRQLTSLKEMGANAIRAAHNPVSTLFQHLTNIMGFLVIEEAFDGWSLSKHKNTNDYGKYFSESIDTENNSIMDAEEGDTWAEFDIRQMVRRSSNAPSVIMYSLGNELLEGVSQKNTKWEYPNIARSLIDAVNELKNDQLITIGDNSRIKQDQDMRNIMEEVDQIVSDSGGVVGFNYLPGDKQDEVHEQHPDWRFYLSETASALSTRDYYASGGRSEEDHQVTAYGGEATSWGNSPWDAWEWTISRDFVAGEFIWSGIDYMGEPTPWNALTGHAGGRLYPRSSYFGAIDIAGFKKDNFYFYQSQWNDDVTTLHLLPHWNGDLIARNEDGEVDVVVYSNAKEVELFLNGHSLGRKVFEKETTPAGYSYQKSDGRMYMQWSVAYEPGILWAVAYDEDGNVIEDTEGRNVVETAGEAVSIRLSAYETTIDADGRSLAYIVAEAVDAHGNVCPMSTDEISFSVEGNGSFVASDNGDPTDITNMKSSSKRLFFGKAVGIVQSTKEAGSITIRATSDGLEQGSITIGTILPSEEREEAEDEQIELLDEYVQLDRDVFEYNGLTQAPSVTVMKDSVPLSDKRVRVEIEEASENGEYTVTVTGLRNFHGTVVKKFKIDPRSISGAELAGIADKVYTGSAITPLPTVNIGSTTLEEGKDYTVSYENNTNAGIATVTITGKGNYKGSISRSFRISTSAPVPASVKNVNGGVEFAWKASKGASKYRVYRKTGTGKWVKLTDTAFLKYTDKTARPGTKYSYTVRCVTADGREFVSDLNEAGKSITYIAVPVLSGIDNVVGGIRVRWEKSAGAAKYRIYRKTGSGKWQKLVDTTALSYTDKNVKPGTKYTYTVRCVTKDGKSITSQYNIKGKTAAFTSRLAPPVLSNPKAKQLMVKWKKNSAAAGYQIQYGPYKSYAKGYKMLSVMNKAAVSATISNLMKGKTYYIRIRWFNMVNGKRNYMGWSEKKNIKLTK